MTADPYRQHMTVEEYLALDQNSPDAKYEYADGVAYNLRDPHALAGGSAAHSWIAINMIVVLDRLLSPSSCRVFNSDMRVQVDAAHYMFPDITISCAPDDLLQENTTINDPRVVIEVLSPSTEAYDRGKKFAFYQQLASLQEYVLVSTQQQAVEVFTREGDAWQYRLYRKGETAQLHSLAISLALVDVYAHVSTDNDQI
jgi:Uma2 family endonuclease